MDSRTNSTRRSYPNQIALELQRDPKSRKRQICIACSSKPMIIVQVVKYLNTSKMVHETVKRVPMELFDHWSQSDYRISQACCSRIFDLTFFASV
ncbi:hypothetical protein COOONC_00800 [Cooperia oncophora]